MSPCVLSAIPWVRDVKGDDLTCGGQVVCLGRVSLASFLLTRMCVLRRHFAGDESFLDVPLECARTNGGETKL